MLQSWETDLKIIAAEVKMSWRLGLSKGQAPETTDATFPIKQLERVFSLYSHCQTVTQAFCHKFAVSGPKLIYWWDQYDIIRVIFSSRATEDRGVPLCCFSLCCTVWILIPFQCILYHIPSILYCNIVHNKRLGTCCHPTMQCTAEWKV